jgi:pyrroloquinoline quinone (PQQ) biosynthesis protein C
MVPTTVLHESALRNTAQKAVAESLERIRQHPFILGATAQTLTQAQAERWIKCAGRESRSFPSILKNMVARCSNETVREILEENLNDEFGNGNPEEAHFKHYLHLLDNLGIPREMFDGYEERAGIKFLNVA